jgi:hypothetical protein
LASLYRAEAKGGNRKVADFCGFYKLRLLRSSTLFVDNRSRERGALPALGLATERAIRLARGG